MHSRCDVLTITPNPSIDLLHTAGRLGYDVVEVPTVWIDQAGSRVRPVRDALRMLG